MVCRKMNEDVAYACDTESECNAPVKVNLDTPTLGYLGL